MTITRMKPRLADIALDVMSAGGKTARAHKACRAYRQKQTAETAAAALAELNGLDDNVLAEIKAAAGL